MPQGTHPKLDSVDGGQAPVAPGSVWNTGESDIDMDIAFSLTYPQTVTLYQVDDLQNAYYDGFNNFLDALDGSYCKYTAYGITGNSPGCKSCLTHARTIADALLLEQTTPFIQTTALNRVPTRAQTCAGRTSQLGSSVSAMASRSMICRGTTLDDNATNT